MASNKVIAGAHPDSWSYAAAGSGIASSTTAVTIASAQSDGRRRYLSALQISHATLGAATEVAVRDGAGGTVLWRGTLGTVANDGVSHRFDPPLKGSTDTLMEFVVLSSVTGGVYACAQGFTAS